MTSQKILQLTSNMEDYLETIYALQRDAGVARVGEIAANLNVKSSSVNSAIKFLSDKGLVAHQKYGYVSLTEAGRVIAKEVQEKHDILFRFLTEFLMLDPSVAQTEACCIEHAISNQTFQRLTKFFKFLEEAFDGEKPKFLKNFESYLDKGQCSCECRSNQREEPMSQITLLSTLKPGDRGVVRKVRGSGTLRRRLLDMGILPGSPFEILKVAPLGDPMDIRIKGYQLTLRKDEAKEIDIEEAS